MKTLLLFLLILISMQFKLSAFNTDFIEYPVQYNKTPFSYTAKINSYTIYVSNRLLLIIKDNETIYKQEFSGVEKIELFDLNNFTTFLYFEDIQKHNFQTVKGLKLIDQFGETISQILLSSNYITITTQKENKIIQLLENKKEENNNPINALPLLWSTIFGGDNDEAFSSIGFDSSKFVYAAGYTKSSITQDLLPIKFSRGQADIVFAKFKLTGEIQWIALVGSSGNEYCMNMAIDSLDNIWLCGETYAGDYYIFGNAVQTAFGGGGDGVITKFNTKGDILLSTYFGGGSYDSFVDICTDKFNNIWLTGRTMSTNYKTTPNGYHTSLQEFYESPVVKLSNDGSLLYSGLFGGVTNGALTLADCIVSDSQGNIIIGGYSNSKTLPTSSTSYQQFNKGFYDSFLTKFDNNATFQWCTYIGGNNSDYGSCLVVDNEDNIILNSYTLSSNLPLINSTLQAGFGGAIDNYITKFDRNEKLLWATYFGGNQKEGEDYGALVKIAGNLKVNSNNDIFFFFRTQSNNLKTSPDALFTNYLGNTDGFILRIDKNSNYLSSTYFGGSGNESPSDIELVNDSSFVICGGTASIDFPLVNSYKTTRDFSRNDGFIAYFGIGEAPPPPPDTTLPYIASWETDPCNTYWKYIVSDTSEVNSGMKSNYQVNIQNNCSISVNLVGKQLIIIVNLTDGSKPGKFNITVYNNCGKSLIIEEDLFSSGSGVEYSFEPNSILDLGGVEFSGMSCRNLRVRNLTNETKIFDELPLMFNLDFTIPQSQFPITIPPKDSVEVLVCFYPLKPVYGHYYDTLFFKEPCSMQSIVLNGELLHSKYSSGTLCDVDILARTDTVKKQLLQITPLTFSAYYSNNEIKISVENYISYGKLEIYDCLGQLEISKLISLKTKEFLVNCYELQSGTYFIVLGNEIEKKVKKILIYK